MESRKKYFFSRGSKDIEKKGAWFKNVQKVKKINSACYANFVEDFASHLEEYKALQEMFKEKGAIRPLKGIAIALFYMYKSGIWTDFYYENEHLRLLPLITIHMTNHKWVDHVIVHELNHLLESHIISYTKEGCFHTSGWNMNETHIQKNHCFSENNCPYELFNEVINERIAQDISKLMIENKMFAFDEAENVSFSNYSTYEIYFCLIEEFYKEYQEEIIESRFQGNLAILLAKIGQENFENMNYLINAYAKFFTPERCVLVQEQLHRNETTSLTLEYEKFMTLKDEILASMRTYTKMRTLSK